MVGNVAYYSVGSLDDIKSDLPIGSVVFSMSEEKLYIKTESDYVSINPSLNILDYENYEIPNSLIYISYKRNHDRNK